MEISKFEILLNFVGSLSIFLFGLRGMVKNLKISANQSLKDVIAHLTKNRFYGFAFGAFASALMQSSSALIAITIGFVDAQILTYTQTMSLVLGAEVGTTMFGQLISFFNFEFGNYILIIFAIGFGMTFSKDINYIRTGKILQRISLLFFGLRLMANATLPLQNYEPVIDIMKNLNNNFLSLIIGLVFTTILHSSGAFLGIMIVISSQGFLNLESVIYMSLGANVGSCIVGIYANLETNRAAKRVAAAQVFYNSLGSILIYFFVPQFANFVRDISGTDSMPRLIANAHSIYNVGMALVFLPFTKQVAKLLFFLIPDKEIIIIKKVEHIKEHVKI